MNKYRIEAGMDLDTGKPVFGLQAKPADQERGWSHLYQDGAPIAYDDRETAEAHLKFLRLQAKANEAARELASMLNGQEPEQEPEEAEAPKVKVA